MPQDNVIIGSIRCTPDRVRVGESLAVEVVGVDGQPLTGDGDAVVTIAGLRGALQYFQFAAPGLQSLPITAAKVIDGSSVIERSVAELRVDAATSDGPELPILRVARTPAHPYVVGLSVGPDSPFHDGLVTGPLPRPPLLLQPPADAKPKLDVRVDRIDVGRLSQLRPTNAGAVSARAADETLPLGRRRDLSASHRSAGRIRRGARTYHWDFGDGQRQETREPHLTHDYRHALAHDREHYAFHVRVRIEEVGADSVEVTRTLSLFSAYVICKRLGTLAPEVAGVTFATRIPTGYQGTMVVRNIEPFALELTSRVVHPRLAQADHVAAFGAEEMLVRPITVPPHGSATIAVQVESDRVPMDALGFTVCYCGTAPDGTAIRASGHFDTAPRDRISGGVKLAGIAVTHLEPFGHDVAGTGSLAGHAPGVSATTHSAIAATTHAGIVTRPSRGMAHAGLDALAPNSDIRVRSGREEPPPADGQECDPDNVSEAASAESWVCQATAEHRTVGTPGRFLNARRGDVVLSPGGPGLIGALLRQVSPPQRYSHCGIMTRNYDQITHSTASQDRMEAYPVGGIVFDSESRPSNGYRPDVVKYGWPGVITQTVEQSIHGEPMLDPETATLPAAEQKHYNVSGFGRASIGMDIGGHWEIVPPLVVRPDPLQEARHPEVRRTLHRVADEALALTGKSHYRFFCYTEPELGLASVAPAEARWAAGTTPTVCSSLIWIACRRQGVRMEGPRDPLVLEDLEFPDRSAGAQVDGHTRDGLYLYNAAERLAAAEYLFAAVHANVGARVDAEVGDFSGVIEAGSDMADDVANQVVNTFASDWSDEEAKDSERWREVSSANAVSPDNIMLWDGPDRGGIYGAVEPLHYREPRLDTITVHRWKRVFVRGTVSGTVRFEGAPAPGATVQFTDGLTTFSDEHGNYELARVPFGAYVVKAAKDQVGMLLTAEVPFALETPESTLDIDLHAPSDWFRVLRIAGTMHIVDSELFDDEVADRVFSGELFVGPYATHAETTFVERMGGEIRVEVRIVADWHVDRSISVLFEQRFYEGSTEETDDLDGSQTQTFTIGADSGVKLWSTVTSSDAGSDRIDIHFSNDVNPS